MQASILKARKNVGLANSGAGANLTKALILIVETQFEKELQQELRAAQFFREIPVQTKQTILPIMPDSVAATFNTGSPTDESNSSCKPE